MDGSDQRYGFKEGLTGGRFALNDSWLGSLLGDPTLRAGADIGAFTAGAEAHASPDTGFALGASANLLEGSISGGTQDAASNTDEWMRFGLSAGSGGALRGYWGNADADTHREYGFGFDAGPVSFDIKTEDPLRSAGRLAGGPLAGAALDYFGGGTNLTDAAGGAISSGASYVSSAATDLWNQLPSVSLPDVNLNPFSW
jgi:hypothetical protein